MATQYTVRTGDQAAWDRSLTKAKAEGLKAVLKDEDTGVYLVASSKPGVWYETSVTTCGCKGGQYFDYCKHRALVRQLEAARTTTYEVVA